MPSMSNHRTTTNQTFYCLHNLDFCFEFGCFIENAQKSDNILQLNVVSWIFTFFSKKKKTYMLGLMKIKWPENIY